jgi:mannan endo-1,4-beta-mannosidase
VIVEARRHGIRLLLSLVNNLPAYGGKGQYVEWARDAGAQVGPSNDSFFSDPITRDYYKKYLKVK